MVSSVPPDLSMGQPVFPSPIPQLVPVNQPDSVNQEIPTSSELVTTGRVEPLLNLNDGQLDKSDGGTTTPPPLPPDTPMPTPPPPPPDTSTSEGILLPAVPPVTDPANSCVNPEALREDINSNNGDGGTDSDSSGRYYKVNKELFVTVHRLPDLVLHKYISKVSISDETEDKDSVGMKLPNILRSKHMKARHPRNIQRTESYASMLASDTDNTDQDVRPKHKVKPRPSLEPSSSRQRSQRIIEKNHVQSTASDMISSNSEHENDEVNDAYNTDTEGESDAQDEPVKPKRGKLTVDHHGLKKTK